MTFWIAGAVAVGTIGSAVIGSSAASSAASAQTNAANAANQTQWNMYNQTRQDNLPALGARNDALSQLEYELGIGGGTGSGTYGGLSGPINVGDVTQDPGYQFGEQQGQLALQRQENARGMSDSGAALKAASEFGTNYATTKYDDAYNRELQDRQQQLNPLLSLAGAGQVGANTIGQAGSSTATAVGNNEVGAGNAAAAADLAQGNIASNGINALAGWYRNYGPSSYSFNANDPVYGGISSYDSGGGGVNTGVGGYAGVYSDERLKTNIRRVGTTARGNAWYTWDWKTGGSGEGVIAQEVAHIPGAVSQDANGLLMVDYSKV